MVRAPDAGVALIGDAGIGKSRLVGELASRAVARGGRVAAGQGYETEQVLPFRLWIEALRSGPIARDKGLLRELTPRHRAALSHGQRVTSRERSTADRRPCAAPGREADSIDGRRTRMEMTEVPGDVRRSYETYVVRIAWDDTGEVKGVVVHVATGERFPFAGLDRLDTLIRERVSAATAAGE